MHNATQMQAGAGLPTDSSDTNLSSFKPLKPIQTFALPRTIVLACRVQINTAASVAIGFESSDAPVTSYVAFVPILPMCRHA